MQLPPYIPPSPQVVALRSLSAVDLAFLVGLHRPSSEESPGARFLYEARNLFVDEIRTHGVPANDREAGELIQRLDVPMPKGERGWMAFAELRVWAHPLVAGRCVEISPGGLQEALEVVARNLIAYLIAYVRTV